MDFLSRAGSYISDLFHQARCYFQPEAAACTPPPRTAKAADRFEPIHLEEVRLREIIRETEPVRVGCYIQMHQVHTPTPEQIEALRRSLPRTGTGRR